MQFHSVSSKLSNARVVLSDAGAHNTLSGDQDDYDWDCKREEECGEYVDAKVLIGSLRRSATPSGGATASMPAQTTNNLLAALFGGGSAPAAATSSPASAPPENLIHDILGLFDITLAAAPPTSTSTPLIHDGAIRSRA
ncbi:hypothetical protein FRC09_009954 [Ceratobasidium sp. 395]|nr:hypothetical protein FRC09_009954 [Ceratobasidium sp. 395]